MSALAKVVVQRLSGMVMTGNESFTSFVEEI